MANHLLEHLMLIIFIINKIKKFINTVENLTVFIEKKNPNGEFMNIYLKDTLDKENSKIISAKKGIISKKNDVFFRAL